MAILTVLRSFGWVVFISLVCFK